MNSPKIFIQLKILGKKKIVKIPLVLSGKIETLGDLLKACIKQGVEEYNLTREGSTVLSFLNSEDIHAQVEKGKIGFGNLANYQKAELLKSTAVAQQAFEDGLFVVFHNDEEIKGLQQPVNLKEGSVISFIRLTFLTGTYW